MNNRQWDTLINAYLDETLDAAGQAEFSALMTRSAPARKRFWELAEIHALVRSVRRYEPAKVVPEFAIGVWRHFMLWLQWRPLAAAMAGVMLGAFSTAVMHGDGYPWLTRHSLPLAHATFEEGASVAPKVPVQNAAQLHGGWSGQGEVVGARLGISPLQGDQMLRFLPSKLVAAKSSDSGMTCGACVTQHIDLRPWRKHLADGKARLDWSAAFNGVAEHAMKKTFYRMDVRTGAAPVHPEEDATAVQGGDGLSHVAHKVNRTLANNDPSKWQHLSGKMLLPPETDFIVIDLRVFHDDRSDAANAESEVWHFVDDVHVSYHFHQFQATRTSAPDPLVTSLNFIWTEAHFLPVFPVAFARG